jgi:branched-chain amino acid transport system substrate-binding protein
MMLLQYHILAFQPRFTGGTMKRLSFVLAIALLGLASAQEPIRIGVNLELSGRFATIGNTTLQGIETAQAQMGTVLDRPIELSVCDNATTVEGSVSCANRFVDEGVLGVLGPIATTHAIPAAEVLQNAGIIMITTASTNPATTQIGEYIFRMAYTDDFQGVVAARYAYDDLEARRAAIFRQQDDDYSFGLAGFFNDEFQTLGGETAVVDFVSGTVDFSAQIADIRGFDPEVIYFSGFCPEGAPLVTQLRQQGFEQQVLAADASDDSQCPEGGGTAFDGVIYTGFGGPEVLSGEAQARAEEFGRFFEEANPAATDFNGFTLAGADSYNVLLEAIDVAGSAEIADVLAALSSLTAYPGVSGEITYEGTDGTPADRTIAFFRYNVRSSNDWDSESLFGLGTGAEDTQ